MTDRPGINRGMATDENPQIALAASKVIKATEGNLYGHSGYNDGPELPSGLFLCITGAINVTRQRMVEWT